MIAYLVGIVRPQSSGTGFGSAMNIETLVAAAEKRGTHIEVLILLNLVIFMGSMTKCGSVHNKVADLLVLRYGLNMDLYPFSGFCLICLRTLKSASALPTNLESISNFSSYLI